MDTIQDENPVHKSYGNEYLQCKNTTMNFPVDGAPGLQRIWHTEARM